MSCEATIPKEILSATRALDPNLNTLNLIRAEYCKLERDCGSYHCGR